MADGSVILLMQTNSLKLFASNVTELWSLVDQSNIWYGLYMSMQGKMLNLNHYRIWIDRGSVADWIRRRPWNMECDGFKYCSRGQFGRPFSKD